MTPTQMRSDAAAWSLAAGGGRTPRSHCATLRIRAEVKRRGIQPRATRQRELQDESAIVDEIGRVRHEHEQAGRNDDEQRAESPGQQMAGEPPHRQLPRQAEQAQIEHRDRAHQR